MGPCRDKVHNPMCDGSHCISAKAPVRLYPLGGSANLILCEACFRNENAYRAMRAKETRSPENWPKVEWASARPYPEDAKEEKPKSVRTFLEAQLLESGFEAVEFDDTGSVWAKDGVSGKVEVAYDAGGDGNPEGWFWIHEDELGENVNDGVSLAQLMDHLATLTKEG